MLLLDRPLAVQVDARDARTQLLQRMYTVHVDVVTQIGRERRTSYVHATDPLRYCTITARALSI